MLIFCPGASFIGTPLGPPGNTNRNAAIERRLGLSFAPGGGQKSPLGDTPGGEQPTRKNEWLRTRTPGLLEPLTVQSQCHRRRYEPKTTKDNYLPKTSKKRHPTPSDREPTAWSQRQSQNVAALIESKAMSLASSNGVSSWARAKEPERRRFRHMAREQIGEATLKRIAAGRLQSASPGSAQPKADRRKNDSSAARGRKAASGLLP